MAVQPNHIYQYSVLNALMDGVCEEGIPATKLLTKGNQGLGTFAHMDGELIMLDGTIYQICADGHIRDASSENDIIPFAMAINFVSEVTLENQDITGKYGIDPLLQKVAPHTANLFVAYRIEGKFDTMRVRTVRPQEYPGQPLAELSKLQSEFEYKDVDGTIVGFRSPMSWQGFSVAGQHLHFLSKDRTQGGHILAVSARNVKIKVSRTADLHIELPRGKEFSMKQNYLLTTRESKKSRDKQDARFYWLRGPKILWEM